MFYVLCPDVWRDYSDNYRSVTVQFLTSNRYDQTHTSHAFMTVQLFPTISYLNIA